MAEDRRNGGHLPAKRKLVGCFGPVCDCRLAVFGLCSWFFFPRTNYARHVGWQVEQLVPFSHEHHVAGLGIDCRFCHTSVEVASTAGLPPTYTCMTCHSQI